MTTVSRGQEAVRDWAEPGPETVVPGVHRVPLPLPGDGLRAVNVYVVETPSGLTCIDGGWAVTQSDDVFRSALATLGFRLSDVEAFLVTHVHRDHYTQAVVWRSELGRPVISLGVGDRPALQGLRAQEDRPRLSQRLRDCGAAAIAELWEARSEASPPHDMRIWSDPDTWLEGESTISLGDRVLSAIPTPGHTAGHYVFADLEAGFVFAGDHVLPTITPSIGFSGGLDLEVGRMPLLDYMESLACLRALPDLRLLPAHGATDRRTHARVDELMAHHSVRLELTRAAVSAGSQTPLEVAAQLPWTLRGRALAELDDFNAGLAVFETMHHLDVLVSQGLLSMTRTSGVLVYQASSAAE